MKSKFKSLNSPSLQDLDLLSGVVDGFTPLFIFLFPPCMMWPHNPEEVTCPQKGVFGDKDRKCLSTWNYQELTGEGPAEQKSLCEAVATAVVRGWTTTSMHWKIMTVGSMIKMKKTAHRKKVRRKKQNETRVRTAVRGRLLFLDQQSISFSTIILSDTPEEPPAIPPAHKAMNKISNRLAHLPLQSSSGDFTATW